MFHRFAVLRMMPWAGRQLPITHRMQISAERLLADRGAIRLHHPLHKIAQPPANHAMNRRDRAFLNQLRQFSALRLIKPGCLTRSLGVHQAVRASTIEPQNPVPERLQTDPACTSTVTSRAAVIHHCQGQQPPNLISVP